MAESMREAVIAQIQDKVAPGLNAFGTNFYETKSQFHEDAMSCYNLHNRPKGQCSDFRSEKKRLSPKTERDRIAAGMPAQMGGPKVYLCDFCPVRVFNARKYNEQQGLYN